MTVFPKTVMLGDTDNGICNLIIKLAGTGHEAEALEAAKALGTSSYRNLGLMGIAAGASPAASPSSGAPAKTATTGRSAPLATAPLNAKDKDGETGLMKAAVHGHVAVVRRLLSGAVEPWEVDKQGRTALMKAAENGQEVVVRAILQPICGQAVSEGRAAQSRRRPGANRLDAGGGQGPRRRRGRAA